MRVSKKQKSIQSTLLGLSPLLWLELVFKHHLLIESGVALMRTCSFFWKSEKIKEWLKEKEITVFGPNTPKSYWNKIESEIPMEVLSDKQYVFRDYICLSVHSTLFDYSKGVIELEQRFGIFSSKERLWKVFTGFMVLNNRVLFYDLKKNYFAFKMVDPQKSSYRLIASNIIKEDFLTVLPSYGLIKIDNNGEGL
jgi:hypothetical protein